MLSRRVRPALIWPGLGVPLTVAVALLDLRPPWTVTLLAVVLVAGVAVGISQHRAGEIRTAKT